MPPITSPARPSSSTEGARSPDRRVSPGIPQNPSSVRSVPAIMAGRPPAADVMRETIMLDRCASRALLLSTATLVVALATPSQLSAQTPPIQLPACGSDPIANTRAVQQAIDQAPAGSTLTLPPGECVLAKCDVARGAICYGAFGRPHLGTLYIGNRSALTIEGADDGASVLKL